jgi:ubiquinone/menaquinone biosynthesis C-methylase UbiE
MEEDQRRLDIASPGGELVMLARLLRWLRGDYNSIRYRFMRLPREWLEYIFYYRLRGGSWVDFYAARLDKAQAGIGPRSLVLKEAYRRDGQRHLRFMKAQGLQPSHKLLDYGCGVCRSGIFFAGYLEPGNYTGVDISKERLEHGKMLMRGEDVPDSAYRLSHLSDCTLRELNGMVFDYVFANSVLTHMPAADIRAMLTAMRPLLGHSGKFFFTFSEADKRKRRNIKDFWYPREEIRTMCEQAGYEFQIAEDWPPKSGIMAVISPKETEMASRNRFGEAMEKVG